MKPEIYKCNVCGKMVEIMKPGAGELFDCGQPMELLKEKIQDEGSEKHVPVIVKTESGVLVKVGEVPHPMEEKHHIEWIEIIADGISYRKVLDPEDEPVAEFCVKAGEIIAREHCSLHGLWKS